MPKKEEKKPWWKSPKKVFFAAIGIWFGFSIVLGLIETARFEAADKVALVPIKGAIGVSSPFGGDGVDATNIIDQLETIEEDDTVKAVILEINSPGGAALASREIADKVNSLEKPTIAWIRDLGASGAYWIASSSDIIVADELSITGSIGVISSYLQFEDLFDEYGITYERLVSGNLKDAGSPFKKLTRQERNFLQNKIDLIHDIFVEDVAKNRNMSVEDIQKTADGSFYLGIEAAQLNLIDVLGGKEQAFNLAEEMTGITEYETVVYEKSKGLLGFLQGASAHSSYFMGKGIGSAFIDDAKVQSIPSFIA
tara:strand:+ start:1067 stop:1999 length:933 start_codon:yes stop_codon:yes gene_type:complete